MSTKPPFFTLGFMYEIRVCYSAQIVLFGAEFTNVRAKQAGSEQRASTCWGRSGPNCWSKGLIYRVSARFRLFHGDNSAVIRAVLKTLGTRM